MNKMPDSNCCTRIPSLDPLREVVDKKKLDGVIAAMLSWRTANSPPVVKICRSLPEIISVIALKVLVSKVASTASSSSPSTGSKSKNKATLDPHIVDGLDLLPPKYNRP